MKDELPRFARHAPAWCSLLAILVGSTAASANTWVNLNPATNANKRDSHAVAYDLQSQKMILYGGHSSIFPPCPECFLDTWAYDFGTNTWTDMNPPMDPGQHAEFAMSYDSLHDRVLLFGGAGNYPMPGPDTQNDLWAYDFESNTWTELTPAASPPPTWNCRMAYDVDSDKTIMQGDSIGTWAYDYMTNTWQNMNPPNPKPQATSGAVTYDANHDRILFFRYGQNAAPNQLWAYDYDTNTWEQRAENDPTIPPYPGGGAMPWMAHDTESSLTIYLDDSGITWGYDWSTDAFEPLNPPSAPPSPHHHSLVYLPDEDRVLFYAGDPGKNQTWAYDANLVPGCVDLDGDGFGIGMGCGGPNDCDDGDPDEYPGGTETCDAKDNDCAGGIDDGNPGGGAMCATGQLGVCSAGTTSCSGGSLGCTSNVQPSAEICGDGLDQDCDGAPDQSCPTCSDLDGDGVSAGGACQGEVDCNDADASIHPGATETCGDGIDQDCDAMDTPCEGTGGAGGGGAGAGGMGSGAGGAPGGASAGGAGPDGGNGNGGDDAAPGAGGSGADPGDDGGCACVVPGAGATRPSLPLAAMALAALGAAIARVRRRVDPV